MRAAEGSHEVHRSIPILVHTCNPYQCLFTFTGILPPLLEGDTESNCSNCWASVWQISCYIHVWYTASPEFLSCPTHPLQNKIKKKKNNPSKAPSLLATRDFINNKKNKKLLQINPAVCYWTPCENWNSNQCFSGLELLLSLAHKPYNHLFRVILKCNVQAVFYTGLQ